MSATLTYQRNTNANTNTQQTTPAAIATMKILHLPSFAALSWAFGFAAAETSTCDESMFGDASQVIDGSVNDIMIKVRRLLVWWKNWNSPRW